MIYALFVALVVFSVCSQLFLWTFAIMQILDGNWINAGNILIEQEMVVVDALGTIAAETGA